MQRTRWIVMAVAFVAICSAPAAAEQPEVLLGIAADFDKGQITLEVASSGCTKKADFRFEYKNHVLTVIRKERDACKAVPRKISLTFQLHEVEIDPHAPFRVSNPFIANDRIAQSASPHP